MSQTNRNVCTVNTEPIIRRLAGTMILISIGLAALISPWWLLLGAFVGVNLIQSSFTAICPAEMIVRRWYAPRAR